MGKIVYNKEMSGKKLGKGGPRDIQLRQRILQEEMIRNSGGLAPHIVTNDKPTSPTPVTDMSQYLPLSDVRKKIEEAVESTKESVKIKYESGLQSMNEQLKESRRKINKLQEDLLSKTAEANELNRRITSVPEISESAKKQINSKDIKILELGVDVKSKEEMLQKFNKDVIDLTTKLENASIILRDKDAEVKKFQELMAKRDEYLRAKDVEIHNNSKELKSKEEELHKMSMELVEVKSKIDARSDVSSELSDKLDRLYQKIADGSIRHLVGSQMDRPSLEDRIFIDPLEMEAGDNLDPYINIKEEFVEKEDRSVAEDTAKLRSLLKLGKGRR